MARRNDKRSRLVTAADKLFHEQGVSTTTLANIAQLADVPLGNVYYYFKSKESIVLAVIDYRRKLIQAQFDELNGIDSTLVRLQTLVRQTTAHSEQTANFGDALGSLCQELGKQGGQIAAAAADLMQEIMNWCEKQFVSLGKGEKAKQLAMILLSSLQGISLLTLTFKNATYTNQQADYLVNWLETV
jgi:TetR/AcrR family transcriptional regulator, transcriptional repressor for nem operon